MRLGFILSIGLWLLLLSTFSGCSGVKVFGEVGVGRIDEMSSSQKMYRKPPPWKCYFTDCDTNLEENDK